MSIASRMDRLFERSPGEIEGRDAPELLPHQADRRQTNRDRYSAARALRMCMPEVPRDGLEGEVHAELKRRKYAPTKGMLIPHDVLMPEAYALDTTTGAGSMRTSLRRTIAAALRSKLVCARLGAQIADFRSDVTGNVALPVATSGSTALWVVEGASTPDQNAPRIGQAVGAPHTTMARVDATRRMIRTASPGFESFLWDDLISGVATMVDRAAVNGSGVAGEPAGLLRFVPGLASIPLAAGAATFAGLLSMKRQVADADADAADDARPGWLSSPAGRQLLEGTDLGTGSGRFAWVSKAVLDPTTGEARSLESVLGQPAAASTSVPSNLSPPTSGTVVIHGNWRHMFIQLFSAIDVMADPFSLDASGTVRFRAYQDVDVMFPYGSKSFVFGSLSAPTS